MEVQCGSWIEVQLLREFLLHNGDSIFDVRDMSV